MLGWWAMESAVEPLEELASLRAMLAASQAKTAAAEAENARLIQEHTRLEAHSAELAGTVARLESQNERYEHIIAQLRRLQFGKRFEQLDKDQLQLAFGDLV